MQGFKSTALCRNGVGIHWTGIRTSSSSSFGVEWGEVDRVGRANICCTFNERLPRGSDDCLRRWFNFATASDQFRCAIFAHHHHHHHHPCLSTISTSQLLASVAVITGHRIYRPPSHGYACTCVLSESITSSSSVFIYLCLSVCLSIC